MSVPPRPAAALPVALTDLDPEILRELQLERPRRAVERTRQIFTNRNLRLDQIEWVGFDMDYTLAVYHLRRVEELSFDMTLARLIREHGYPPDVGALRYDHRFVIRGLVIDKKTGNLLKMNRHNHVGRCYHGRRRLGDEERRALYRTEKIRLSSPRYAWIDTLFALPEACLFASIIELEESRGHPVDYRVLYDDIRESIDMVHRDGSLKERIRADLDRYVLRDPELGPTLHKLRSAGKRLFLLTNSAEDYTATVMTHLLDGVLPEYPSWKNYFDVSVVSADKPAFFSERHPFVALDAAGRPAGEARSLERGRLYQGGNIRDLEAFVGSGGERILYVGDHIYGDILRSKKVSLWRTCMIVQELEEEIAYVDKHAHDFDRLAEVDDLRTRLEEMLTRAKIELGSVERRMDRGASATAAEGEPAAELEEKFRQSRARVEKLRRFVREVSALAERLEDDLESGYNPYWGFVFKEGNENSRFGEQVEDYADLYTSRVSNFVNYSPVQYFRSPRAVMPHER